jgi:hypothetical protein
LRIQKRFEQVLTPFEQILADRAILYDPASKRLSPRRTNLAQYRQPECDGVLQDYHLSSLPGSAEKEINGRKMRW